MAPDTYTVRLTFDTLTIQANLADAAAPIAIVNDHGDDGDTTVTPTPYQTADCGQNPRRMVHLVLEFLGDDYWLDPSLPVDEDGAERLINGKTVAEHLDSLIVSIAAK